MQKEVVLTGVKPTGRPHIGNYLGAIQPALKRAEEYKTSFFFIADYHALNGIHKANDFRDLTLSVAATWLASGLDHHKIHFYRQSDILEVFELAIILANFTPKGWMNKAHAYKAAVDKNEGQSDLDAGINMGLYNYPILMAADILLFNAQTIPVGKDQIQHVEIARDIAQRFNHHYQADVFVLPQYELVEDANVLPGNDGRKMSKSYGNTIPLFASESEWKKAVSRITTDSSAEHDPKDPASNSLFEIFCAIATEEEKNRLEQELKSGAIGWGTAKQRLTELLVKNFGEMSKMYLDLIEKPEEIYHILEAGAQQVRPIAQETMGRVHRAIGK